jgi:hypothetical protein
VPLLPRASSSSSSGGGGINPPAAANTSTKPLIAEPEVSVVQLQQEDEFVILGCDGLWDVMSSQRAVEVARMSLQKHNDPQLCAQELVQSAQDMWSNDNISVIVVALRTDPPVKRTTGMLERLARRSLQAAHEAPATAPTAPVGTGGAAAGEAPGGASSSRSSAAVGSAGGRCMGVQQEQLVQEDLVTARLQPGC